MESTRSPQLILLVDDDPNDRLLAIRELSQEFPDLEIETAITWEQFEASLQRLPIELVITDYDLRWATGINVLHAVKQYQPDMPVVMFTDSGTQEIAVAAMKAGLDDYVLKSPKHMIRLSQAVRTAWQNTQVRRHAAELEFRLQFLLNELQVGVFRASLDGRLIEASAGLLHILAVPDMAAAQAFFQTHLVANVIDRDGRQPWQHQVQVPRPANAQPRWLQINAAEISIGGQTYIDGLVSDITTQKQTATALQTLNQTLEDRVEQRTQRLKSLNRELELFAFSVSHDLRSPVRQIDGFVTLLEQQIASQAMAPEVAVAEAETENDAPVAMIYHYVGRIRMLTNRAGKMIDDLLQFSRTGRAEMELAEVSMMRLVQEVIRQVESQANYRPIRWQVDNLPTVWGDRNLLRKAWQNLIENAAKYTRHRPQPQIHISSEQHPHQTVFLVEDNGIGFDEAEASRLFGVFQRLSNAQEFEGTGVGLANAQRVIHRHQGQVWFTGKLNEGATFYFSIPHKGKP